MNLDELQIKISIELDDLNKQLKSITKGIDEALGPKATKKLMADNNKVIKSGLTSINKTTLNLVKKSRKDTTKEVEAMSKDINKSLNKAFDINLTKFNSNITSAMNQARQTVRSACNDIRRELNAALNINGNIRVTSKTTVSGSATGSSGSNVASNMASSQYIGAMIIKSTNAVIANNNANTKSTNSHIDKATNKIVSAIKSSKGPQSGETTVNVSNDNSDIVSAITRLENFNSEGFRAISGDINKSADRIVSAIKSTNNSTVGGKAGNTNRNTNSRGSVINDVPYTIIDDDTEEKIKQLKKGFETLRIESGKVNFNLGKEGPIDDEQIKKMRKAFDMAKKIRETFKKANIPALPAPKQDDKPKKKPPYKKVTVEQGVPVPVRTTSTKPKTKEKEVTVPKETTKADEVKEKSNEKISKALEKIDKFVGNMGKTISTVSKGVKLTKEYADKTAGAINKVKEKKQATKSPGVISSLGSSLGKVTEAIAEPTAKAAEVVAKDIAKGLGDMSKSPSIDSMKESLAKMKEASKESAAQAKAKRDQIKSEIEKQKKIEAELEKQLKLEKEKTSNAQKEKNQSKSIRPETYETATFDGKKKPPVSDDTSSRREKLIDEASLLAGKGLNDVVGARDIANAILHAQIGSIEGGKYGQHQNTGPSQMAEVLPAHLLANITEGFEGPLDDILQAIESALAKAGIKLTAKIASKIGPMIYDALVEQDGNVDRAFKAFKEDVKSLSNDLFSSSKGTYGKITPEMLGGEPSTISPKEANTNIQTGTTLTHKHLENVKKDLDDLRKALQEVRRKGKEGIIEESDIEGLNGRLRTTVGKLETIDNNIGKLRNRNNELKNVTIPGSDLNIESSKNSSEIAELYNKYAELFQLRLKYGKSIKELEDKIKVNIDTSEAEHNLNNLKNLASDLSKITPDLNAENGMEDYHRKQMSTILDANAGEVGAFTKNLKLEAFTADIAKLNSRLDAAADDLMEVIRTLGDLGGSDDLKKCEEMLRQLSQTDLSHLNRDIKKLAESVSGANFDTSAIKKLQDRLISLQQVRNRVSMIRSKAARGKGIDEEALKVNFRAIKNSNNAVFGEGGSDSLGFSAYRIELEKLAKLAKSVGAKIKKALSSAFTNIKTGKLHINVSNILNKTKGSVSRFSGKIKTALSNAFSGIKSNKLYTSVVSGLNKAKGAVSKFAGKVKPILNKAFTGIKVGAKVTEDILKGLGKALGALKKFANGCKTIWGKIKQIFHKGASDASKATEKLTSGLKGLLTQAFGFFSIYSLINIGKQAIQESQTLAQSEIKLASLMQQRMGATKETIEAIRQMAEEHAKLGVVSETAMKKGAEQLAMYVHSAKALKELMPAIANLTAKRGGFNATPEDAEEIATQLGEAIREGTTTPLEQSGIYLSEAEIQKFAQLRTEEERAAYLADVVAKNVGNINQALANTPHGAIAQLKNNFKSLLGTLGIFLANVIKPIVQWLNVIVVACNNALKALGKLLGFDMTGGANTLADMNVGGGSTSTPVDTGSTEIDTGGVDNVKDAYDGAADAADKATEANEKFKGSLMGFDEINTLSNNTDKGSNSDSGKEDYDPTDITPGEGGQLTPLPEVGELTEGENIFGKFGDKIKAFMDEVLEPFKAAWDELGNRWKEEWADLVKSFEHFCTSLATFLKSVWDNGGKEFVQHLAEIGLACGIAAMEIGGEILDSLARLWEHLDPATNMNTQGFLDALNEVSVKIKDFILGLGDHFESLMANGGQDVLNALGDCFMNLGEAATRGIGVVVDALDGLIDHLDPANNAITRGMLKAWEEAFHAVGQMALDFASLLESTLGNGGQNLLNALGDLAMNIGELLGNIVTEVSECMSKFFEHMDPETNKNSKKALESLKNLVESISGFVDMLGESISLFMDSGGQEFINNLGDIIVLIVDLAAAISGGVIDNITAFFDSWAGHLVIQAVAKSLEIITDALEWLLKAIKPVTPLISGLLTAFLGYKAITGIASTITGIVTAIGKLKGISTVVGFVTNLIGTLKTLGGAGGILGIVKGGFTALWGIIAANPITATIAAIAAVGAALVALYNNCEGFREFADKVLEGFKGAFDKIKEHLNTLIEDIKEIFGNVIDIITGIFEGDGEKVGEAVRNLIINIVTFISDMKQAFLEVGWELIKGLVQGIWECIKNLPSLLAGFLEFVVDFFKGLFGIHSPSTVFADLGVNLIEGLIEGITSMISAIGDIFTNIKDSVVGWVKDIVDGAVEKWGELKESITTNLGELHNNVSEKWQEIKENVSEKCKDIYEDAEEKYTKLKDSLTDITDKWRQNSEDKWTKVKEKTNELTTNLKNTVEDRYTKFKDKLTDTMENWRSNSEDKWNKVKNKTSELVSNLKSDTETKYNTMKENLTSKLETWRSTSEKKWNDIKEKGVSAIENIRKNGEEKFESLKNSITSKMETIKSDLISKWETVKSKTIEIVNNLKSDVENKYNDLKTNLGRKLEEVKSEAISKWESIKSTTVSKVKDVVDEATSKFGEMKSSFTSKMDEVKKALEPKWNDLKNSVKTNASGLGDKVTEGLSNIKQKFTKPFEDAKKAVGDVISGIGRTLKNADWSLPKLKMPHLSVSGGFSLNPPSVPRFSVEWYKRGGIIDGITPLGFANGSLHMGGEAGKEMVVPLENTSFTSKIAQAMGQAVDNAMARNMNGYYGSSYNVIDDNRDIVLKINDREFARASINSINKLQRESGRTLLDI